MTNPFDPDTLRTAEDVAHALERCLGHDPARDRGVLHSAAVWEGPHGPRAIRIGQYAPASRIDYFLLHVARARASAILTTGRILRDEPSLHYDLGDSMPFGGALADYRKRRVGLADRAEVVVMSRGTDVNLAHPTFHGWASPVLMLPDTVPHALDDRATFHGIATRRVANLDLDSALTTLARAGHETILVEAGPSTTSPRYTSGRGFDELILSRYLDPAIDSRAIGAEFADRTALERIFGAPRNECPIDEPSGRWSIARYRVP